MIMTRVAKENWWPVVPTHPPFFLALQVLEKEIVASD